jgi:hypothetical protein
LQMGGGGNAPTKGFHPFTPFICPVDFLNWYQLFKQLLSHDENQ